MPDQPTPEEKKTPAAKPGEPQPAEPKPEAAAPAPAKPAEPKPEAAAPAPAKPAAAGSAAAQPAPAKPVPTEPAAAKPAPAKPAAAGPVPVAPKAATPKAAEPGVERDDAAVEDRDALRAEWADEAQRTRTEHDKRVRRFLLRLSLANWGIAIVAWTISAFLGITSPASIIVYSVLFVIGLVAAILAILTYLLEKFGHEPQPLGAISADEGDGDSGDGAATAAKGDTAAPAAT